MNLEKAIYNLKLRGYTVQHFATGEEAAAYLCAQIRDTEVGIGGCKTADQLGLYEKLSEGNTVYWHWRVPGAETLQKANAAPVYINKLRPDFASALERARNVAAVQNCKRFPAQTPCKLDDRCHDCRSADRICRALLVLWAPMMGMEAEVILIDEDLGM